VANTLEVDIAPSEPRNPGQDYLLVKTGCLSASALTVGFGAIVGLGALIGNSSVPRWVGAVIGSCIFVSLYTWAAQRVDWPLRRAVPLGFVVCAAVAAVMFIVLAATSGPYQCTDCSDVGAGLGAAAWAFYILAGCVLCGFATAVLLFITTIGAAPGLSISRRRLVAITVVPACLVLCGCVTLALHGADITLG